MDLQHVVDGHPVDGQPADDNCPKAGAGTGPSRVRLGFSDSDFSTAQTRKTISQESETAASKRWGLISIARGNSFPSGRTMTAQRVSARVRGKN